MGPRWQVNIDRTALAQLLVGGEPIDINPPNVAPEWTSTPSPSFSEGVGGTYNLNQNTTDADGDSLTYAEVSGPWDADVSLASNGVITVTASALEGTYPNLVASIDDGTAAAVNSPSFTITVTPSSADGHRWNPGHYLKVQGKPCVSDQTAWLADVLQKIDNFMDDDPLIRGALVGICWEELNPTGTTYDPSFLNAVLDRVAQSNKYLILQVQAKSFSNDLAPICPADIASDCEVPTKTGQTAAFWRDGTGGFADIGGRYELMIQWLIDNYDQHPNLEIVMTHESAPSFGSVGSPADYSVGALDTALRNIYAVGAGFQKVNFGGNVNNLGTGADDRVPGLVEYLHTQRVMHAGPDAKPANGYQTFEGVQYGTIPPTRDYRTLMGAVYTASEDVIGTGPGDQGKPPAEVIDDEQNHKTTHLAWIPSPSGTTTWTDILNAINADPLLHTTCPSRYLQGCEP